MPSDTELQHTAEHLLTELPGSISRDTVTIVAGQTLSAGDVVGKITASGKYAIYNNAAADGTEVAAGVLYADVDASAADKTGVIHNWSCEVRADKLGWNGQLAAAITAGLADLAAKGIKAR